MAPIIETRILKVYNPISQKIENMTKNICLSKNGREIVSHWDGYYYVKANYTISKKRCINY